MQMRLGSLQQYPLTLQTAVVDVAESLEKREREREREGETKGRKEEERTVEPSAGWHGGIPDCPDRLLLQWCRLRQTSEREGGGRRESN